MAFLQEYEKLQMIGKGSFATIWKVRHLTFGYVRAIKVSNDLIDSEDDPAYKTFLNECKMLLKIGNGSHPNIVHIYQPRLIENRAIVEMDYIDGVTLNEYLQKKIFIPIDEVYRFFNEIVGALAYCHHDIFRFLMDPNVDDLVNDPKDGSKYIIDEETERRLVAKYAITHNDLHSNNVMRRNYDGSFVLLDFGLSIQDGKAVKSSSRRGGALEYMSPEKFDDSSVISTQSDVYSLGILLYEILAGRVPFMMDPNRYSSNPTASSFEMMTAHKTAIPPAIEPLRREAFEKANPGQTYRKDFPEWLEAMVLKCLEKNPAERYADAKELLDDFKELKKDGNSGQVTFVPNSVKATPTPTAEAITTPTPVSNDVKTDYEPARPSSTTIIPPPLPTHETTNGRSADATSTTTPKPIKPATQPSPKKKSHAGLVLGIVFGAMVLLAGLGLLGMYLYGIYEDSQYEHYYTYANSLILRSSAVKKKDNSNKIASLPYGTELLMVNHGSTWSEVKAKTADGKQEGFVSSDYILSQSDYFLLDGIFSNQAARDWVNDSKYRDALLKYYKEHNYRGYISDEAYKAMGQNKLSDRREVWQLTSYAKESPYNSIIFCKEYNKKSKHDDLVMVLNRYVNGYITERKLVYLYIDDSGKSYNVYEEPAPSDAIKSVKYFKSFWRDDNFEITYN
ncbi:MAG: protein kinase [Bacteroidales bacterium]|nr:protein kinase [Bacteroidales bacterium]